MVSYYIEADAHVMQIPHGNSRTNQKSYVRTCPSEVKKRPCNIKQEDAIFTDTADSSGSIVLQEPHFEVRNEVNALDVRKLAIFRIFILFLSGNC